MVLSCSASVIKHIKHVCKISWEPVCAGVQFYFVCRPLLGSIGLIANV